MQEMMTVVSDAGEQFIISFGAHAVEGQCGVLSPHCRVTNGA